MATDTALSAQERLALINKNLAEVLNPEIIEDVIVKQNRPLSVYWGTATTGRPHCGYFVPVMKIGELLRAGCRVKILLADIHAFLDAMKAPMELVKFRAQYYRFCITALLQAVNVPIDRLEFVLGSSYQLSPEYTMDLFKITSVVSEHDSKKAGSEVVKQEKDAKLSGLIYPLMQALDEEHLGVDAQFGGVDQRKIFALAMDALPRLGYKVRAHLMNPMVPGLQGGKMSASDPDSKIDLLDPPDVIQKKLRKAFAQPKVVEGNGLLSFIEYVLLPAGSLKHGEPLFEVPRHDAETLVYTDIKKIHSDYENDILTPQLLKPAISSALIELMKPIQEAYNSSPEWQANQRQAYPPPEEKKKKVKKDKGNRYPGGAKPEVPAPNAEAIEDLEKLKLESKPADA
ncbi:tyrosyl-tRNA synthetase [Trichodelitschia bisporula]|uniref:Tyrosine--tRNA ligase n=1 Tax=Trichodelitschia bisporula TaxID=703511 RepID=A0A6G1I5G9_9PEZI|nr:tyrosyl-tRNA synthetase [Trichodelitschia bisporula]